MSLLDVEFNGKRITGTEEGGYDNSPVSRQLFCFLSQEGVWDTHGNYCAQAAKWNAVPLVLPLLLGWQRPRERDGGWPKRTLYNSEAWNGGRAMEQVPGLGVLMWWTCQHSWKNCTEELGARKMPYSLIALFLLFIFSLSLLQQDCSSLCSQMCHLPFLLLFLLVLFHVFKILPHSLHLPNLHLSFRGPHWHHFFRARFWLVTSQVLGHYCVLNARSIISY